MSISRLPPFPSFLFLLRFASLFRPSAASVRPSMRQRRRFPFFEVRLLPAATAASAVCASSVRLLTGGGGGGDGGFGVDYFFVDGGAADERGGQTLDLSAAPTATNAAIYRRPSERGQPRAKATMNSFPPSFLPSFCPLAPPSTSTNVRNCIFLQKCRGHIRLCLCLCSRVGLFSDFGSAEMVRKGKEGGGQIRATIVTIRPRATAHTSCLHILTPARVAAWLL